MKKLPTLNNAKGYFDLPESHQPVVHTPPGGTSCSNCRWVSADRRQCRNHYYYEWMGTTKLPGPANEVCSDWWESAS